MKKENRVDQEEERVNGYLLNCQLPFVRWSAHGGHLSPSPFFAPFFAFFFFRFLLLFFSFVSFLSLVPSNLLSVHLSHTHSLPTHSTLILNTRPNSQPTFPCRLETSSAHHYYSHKETGNPQPPPYTSLAFITRNDDRGGTPDHNTCRRRC
ncbi:MAG: hypothetical protein JOS17DRAFT_333789 [Linnemannia elongata]|nr:MAG: hypothetical protein JOS17DRAFT_333789 [Linnemannia elongata]